MDSGPICIPAGLHCGHLMFEPIAIHANLQLIEYPDSTVTKWNQGRRDEITELISKNPALLVIPTNLKVNEELIKLFKKRPARLASVSTGTDHVDLKLLKQNDIIFTNAPGVNAASVAEYVVSALSLVCDETDLLTGNLCCGIIGYGHTGSNLGRLLDLINIPFKYYDPFLGPDKRSATLDEVLQADILSFHVPLTGNGLYPTINMVGSSTVKKITPRTFIINTSRGKIFSSESYYQLCNSCPTIMDVFPVEPPPAEMVAKATFASPHIAGYNYAARVAGSRRIAVDFALELGFDPTIIPSVPEIDYDHYVIDFLEKESADLKRNPATFLKRRGTYSARGDLSAARKNIDINRLSPFRRKVLLKIVDEQ